MARAIRYRCGAPWRAAAIWALSVFLIFLVLRFCAENSRFQSPPRILLSIMERRSELYDKMARDLEEHGAAFLRGGETSQSLSLSDIFCLKNGSVTPILKPADPPVRANVLYLSSEYAAPLSQAVRDVFLPYFDEGIWFQNVSMYHFSMFHASHHLSPVRASDAEIEAEVRAVEAAAEELCPLKVVLDRVVLTSTGVLLGCWQVVSGSDPLIIREKLRKLLPRAPKEQLYDPVLLHTSFARLLRRPKTPIRENPTATGQLLFLRELVKEVNRKVRGFEAWVSKLWFVEELDLLALALNGRMKVRGFDLSSCSGRSGQPHGQRLENGLQASGSDRIGVRR
ncbi:unnamed protein product [Spirodela intermedia]|uniref:Uncharacterized protein n=1 Tax=Spirodela intermedia TaxID=51605 RepID=A0A7I8J413_SPIIN|nr:unnamed protein product [Spirodela intermedia]CAA6664503.1 unnamed protein product [Spirodela intermedia]